MGKKLQNTVVKQVFFRIGKDSTTGEFLYRRAPFDAVFINGTLHVRPWIGGMNDQALGLIAADSQEDRDMWRQDIGYESIESIIIDECQMGDESDTWMGLHRISNF